jgi:hypothetical protein
VFFTSGCKQHANFRTELLSREGEIAIAKRIEAGREAMIAGLCESPLTFQAVIAGLWTCKLQRHTRVMTRRAGSADLPLHGGHGGIGFQNEAVHKCACLPDYLGLKVCNSCRAIRVRALPVGREKSMEDRSSNSACVCSFQDALQW